MAYQAAEAERLAVEEARQLAEDAQAAALAAVTAEREERERLEAEAAAARAEAERREMEALAKEEEARQARDELEAQRSVGRCPILIHLSRFIAKAQTHSYPYLLLHFQLVFLLVSCDSHSSC